MNETYFSLKGVASGFLKDTTRPCRVLPQWYATDLSSLHSSRLEKWVEKSLYLFILRHRGVWLTSLLDNRRVA